MTRILADLPPIEYLILGCIVVCVIGLIGFAIIIQWGRKLVANVAEIVQNQISVQSKAAPVAVQQPLEVKPHEPFTPIAKHQELEERVSRLDQEVDDRIAGLADASSKGREKIYIQLNQQAGLLAKNTEKTDLTYAQLQQVITKLDNILIRLPRTQ